MTFIRKAKVFLETLTLLFFGPNCVMWLLLAARESEEARIFSKVHEDHTVWLLRKKGETILSGPLAVSATTV